MDSRAAIVASCWIAVAIISAVYIWVGGINVWNNIVVGLLVFMAFIITFGVGFRLARFQQGEEKARAKPEIQLLNELQNIKSKLDELTKEVEEIKKVIEE